MASPLSKTNLTFVVRELDEVALAMSVTGTRRKKLVELGQMADEVIEALIGDRPEVTKLRAELEKLSRGVKMAGTKAKQSAQAVRAMRDGVKKVQKLVNRGLGDADVRLKVGGFEVDNVWGHTATEVRATKSTLIKATKILHKAGLDDLVNGEVLLDPDRAGSDFSVYEVLGDLVVINVAGGDQLRSLLMALGRRAWVKVPSEKMEPWGGLWAADRFAETFADALTKKVDAKVAALLKTTISATTP